VALAACRRGTRVPPLPPGEIVGASDAFGHRLRDQAPPVPPADRWHYATIVIAGAGVAGLSAAWQLHRTGIHDFVVLELEPAVGGTARSGASPVSAYPWGAHYIAAPGVENRWLSELLREMGVMEGVTVAEQFLCRAPEERVFYRGRWYEGLYLRAGASREDERQLAAFEAEVARWVDFRDGFGRRAFAIPISTGSDDAEVTALDRLSMAEWLDEHGFTSPRLRWWIEYGCRDDYGATLETTSAWAGIFYFASRVPRGGEDSQPLVTWPEGNGRLVAHLAAAAGERVRTGVAVADLVPVAGRPGRRDGVDVVAVTADGTAFGIHAQQVIFAGPQFVARRVIRPWRDDPPPHIAAFQYGAWMVANLHLKDRPSSRGFPLAWDNVLYDSPSLGYVVATHQRGIDHGPTIFTYYYPMTDADPSEARRRLLSAGQAEWADVALADLSRAHPNLRGLVERLDVMRWGHAMVRPAPGFVWGGARAAAARQYRGIHFAHTELSGVALFEEAFDQGIRAAHDAIYGLGLRGQTVQ
jgi:phytoene dehydrogenase-like protein